MNIFQYCLYVLKSHKLLFYILTCYVGITTICTYVQKEAYPFFVWGMYSGPMIAKDTFEFCIIRYDQKNYDDDFMLDHHKRFFYTYQVPFAIKSILQHKYADDNRFTPFLINNFPFLRNRIQTHYSNDKDLVHYRKWLKEYTQRLTHSKIDSINIHLFKCFYDVNGKLVTSGEQVLWQ